MGGNYFVGILGEIVVAATYLARGYSVVAWRKRFGRLEADLVLKRGREVVLVEVKTGRFMGRSNLERLFTFQKVQNLKKIAVAMELGAGKGEVRVDFAAVDFSSWLPRVRRYPSVCLW